MRIFPLSPFLHGVSAVICRGNSMERQILSRKAKQGDRTMGVNAPLDRKLRMGLVGGGQGAFIGKVHSIAATLDNRATLVAGALSSDPARAKASAPDYDLAADRAYGASKAMAAKEAKLPAAHA